MDILTGVHIAGGIVGLAAGAVAVTARKGGRLHGQAGTWFAAAMLLLGASAAVLDWTKTPAESGLGGVMACYFVATSWMTARRRDGTSGRFEIAACSAALGVGALMLFGAVTGTAPPTPVGMGPVYVLGALCLVAGGLDLSVILRARLAPAQRITRHLWRMLFAFFIATGSFFLGQQDVMPEAVRGSPALFVLAFAPFAVMAYWLVRGPFGRRAPKPT